ncbi:MAG: peroxiredoxin family protein [Mariniblastus sp.]
MAHLAKSCLLLALLPVAIACGCFSGQNSNQRQIKFKDDVETNVDLPANVDELEFLDTSGQKVNLSDFIGKKNVVLVITRGFSGKLCPFCTTQTSRLISNYGEISKRNAEVLLVYPGSPESLDRFIEAAMSSEKKQVDRVPFPILLDEELQAVNFFDISDALAFPSTYVIDKEGKVRFAYVGSSPSDRPSLKALLKQLDDIVS